MAMQWVNTVYGPCRLDTAFYRDGTPALLLRGSAGEQVATLTVCLPQDKHLLGPGELFIKTWSENEPLVEPLLVAGLFQDTGRRVRTGYAYAAVWKPQGAALKLIKQRAPWFG